MKTSGVRLPPEGWDTTSAPPDDGRWSRLRTSARWYCLISGPMVFATCLVNAGSHWTVSRFARAPEPLPAILDPSRFPLVVVGQRFPRDALSVGQRPLRACYSHFWRMSYPLAA